MFVNNAAHNSSNLNTALTDAGFTPSAINWTAIASTETTNARTNTLTRDTDPSAPIYTLDGTQIATSSTDLWDGSILSGISFTQTGSETASPQDVWTGTSSIGETMDSLYLGSTSVSFGKTVYTDDGWVQRPGSPPSSSLKKLYGISAILTIPTPAATPEPSSLLGFIALGGLLLGSTVRKARK